MLAVGSNLNPLTNQEEETLVGMGRDEVLVQDVEEGEISDSGSIEEISEEDFKKQDARVLRTNGGSNANANANSNARVWTMRDVYRYPISSGYTSGLYNLAWAQAVQNKSLDEVFVKIDPNDNSKRSPSSSSSITTPVNSREDKSNCVDFPKEATKIVIGASGDGMDAKMDDPEEKEEGELEEGEIDLDLEPTEEPRDAEEGVLRSNLKASDDPEVILEERDMEKVVNSILESLRTVTVVDAEKSFTGVCWRLQNILEKLQEVILGKSVPMKDTLLLRSFSAIQTVHSVFCSMVQKEQNKDILTRLLAWVMRQIPPLFIPDQMKEIEAMISSIDNFAALPSIKASDIEKEVNVILGVNQSDSEMLAEKMEHELNSSKSFLLDSTSSKSLNKNGLNMLSVVLKPVLSGLKGRAGFGPLIDLHKDHDIESLPSPTREAPSCSLAQGTLALGDGLRKPELAKPLVQCKAQDQMIHPYETDALAAVSTYQQKFGQNSFLSGNRLPSPTPSEGGDNGDDDTNEEVSSRASNINIMKAFSPPLVSSAPGMESGSAQGMTGMEYVGSLSSGSNPTIRASAKSRDPRLRLANSNVKVLDLNQRPLPVVYDASIVDLGGKSGKHKPAEDSVFNGPAMKKPRTVSRTYGAANDVQTFSGTGGWLEDTGTLGPQFTNKYKLMENDGLDTNLRNGITSSGAGSGKDTVIAGSDRLPAILKNIAVNPSMLLDILKQNEQQRLSVEAHQKSAEPAKIAAHLPSTKNLAVPSLNVSPVKPSGFAQKPLGKLEGLSQAASMSPLDEMGKVRMKPRDPRRILLNNTLQNSGSLGSEQLKINEGPTLNTQESKLAVATSRPSLSAPPPDITSQFTKNLKNIADLMSASQASTTPTIQQIPSPPVQVTSSGVDVKPVIPDSERNRIGTPLTPTEGVATTNQSQNNWGDVEHLFEGFDDQQKAAIQKERTRRLEEQKKMFAARKLCLVLDLDHTLLNSAKFGEVDPLHEEMLRKKEEQDCEKPQRHLFRFPHMGMWTKLRPGIWNFLEKASKLYELHLYTMGNKLYATEMAKVLDTKGVLFSGRVIARGDDGDLFDGEERVPKIKDLDGVLGMESSIVIIDDSVRVWPHNKLNLIVVERYTYFPSSRRQFGLPGPSLLEIDHDERQEDGTLASSLAVIEKLHQMFFANQSLDEVDVRNILASEQRRILSGCRIVFSRVFPVGEASPHLHPLWQTAEQFGAVCTNQIDEQVTHVVANSLGTDKVNWAISTGRYVVHPGWVEASALLYRRASEQDFAVKP